MSETLKQARHSTAEQDTWLADTLDIDLAGMRASTRDSSSDASERAEMYAAMQATGGPATNQYIDSLDDEALGAGDADAERARMYAAMQEPGGPATNQYIDSLDDEALGAGDADAERAWMYAAMQEPGGSATNQYIDSLDDEALGAGDADAERARMYAAMQQAGGPATNQYVDSLDDEAPGAGEQGPNAPPVATPADPRRSGGGKPFAPLPDGVNLDQATVGASISSGQFGAVSWVEGATGTPPLVIKVPKGQPDKRAETMADLAHEAAVYAKAGPHANIASCYGIQQIGGQQGLVMEGIQGSDMAGVLDKLQALSKGDARAATAAGLDHALSQAELVGTMQYMLRETLTGLAHLEKQGVIHADVRPANIMCDAATGAVKIVDFGLSFDANTSSATGRVAPVGYGMVPPEMGRKGETMTANVDTFAAGEIARQTMEHEQFLYGGYNKRVDWDHARAFGEKDDDGQHQQALRMMERPAEADEADEAVDPFESVKSRIEAASLRLLDLAEDEAQAGNPAIKRLQRDLAQLGKVPEGAEKLQAVATFERRVGLAEGRLKTTGKVAANTQYVQFVNWAMHPDPAMRPKPSEVLQHAFLQDSLLQDEEAQGILKKLLGGYEGSTASADGTIPAGTRPAPDGSDKSPTPPLPPGFGEGSVPDAPPLPPRAPTGGWSAPAAKAAEPTDDDPQASGPSPDGPDPAAPATAPRRPASPAPQQPPSSAPSRPRAAAPPRPAAVPPPQRPTAPPPGGRPRR